MKTRGERKPLPRRSPEDRRRAILDAAQEAFADRDYESVPVSEIVRRAGVAQGTFYLYFPTKQAVLYALAERLVAELDAALDRVAQEQPTVIDFLRAMQKVASKIMRRYHAVLPLLDPEVMFFGKKAERPMPNVRLLETTERLIRRDQENGAANPRLDPVITARLIVSGVHRNGRDCMPGAMFQAEPYTEQMLAFFAAGLR